MFPIRTKNRRAISAVLTTIIILVASIVLGTGVVVYSTSLFQTGGQQQAVQVQGVKGWVNSTAQAGVYTAWGAAAVRNSGDKILSVDNIQMRGAQIPFTSWFADVNQTRVNSGSNFQAQFNLTKTDMNGFPIGSSANGGGISPTGYTPCTTFARNTLPGIQGPTFISFLIDEDGYGSSLPLCLTQQSGPISLNPGAATIIYYKVQSGVFTGLDSGAITIVSIFAGKVGAPQSIRVANP